MKKVLSLVLLLSVVAPIHAETFEELYLQAFAAACKKASANTTHANVEVQERKTTFTTRTHGKDLIAKVLNFGRRLTGYEEKPATVTLTGKTEFSGGETDAQAKFKEAVVSYTSNPDAQTELKCAKVDHDKGSTITCKGTFNLKEFKETMDALSK